MGGGPHRARRITPGARGGRGRTPRRRAVIQPLISRMRELSDPAVLQNRVADIFAVEIAPFEGSSSFSLRRSLIASVFSSFDIFRYSAQVVSPPLLAALPKEQDSDKHAHDTETLDEDPLQTAETDPYPPADDIGYPSDLRPGSALLLHLLLPRLIQPGHSEECGYQQ